MSMLHPCSMARFAALTFALTTVITAQQTWPSSDSADIPSYSSSPRFWVNGSDFDHFRVVPLGYFARVPQSKFYNIEIEGRLVHVDASNAADGPSASIFYISCDPEDYGGVIDASDVMRTAANSQPGNGIILYSTRKNHCQAIDLRSLPAANGVFSTLDSQLAATVAEQIGNSSAGAPSRITPDLLSYQSPSNTNSYPSAHSGPTTAVAMIILYTITGLITALFIVIIITGAIRAHRHPERYGPRNVAGRARRSRAKGLARAMLDTIPIVKFGERDDAVKKDNEDVEMAAATGKKVDDKSKAVEVEQCETSTHNADGMDDSGQLGCSICTEDFSKGEEVRVLPCNHKFHPECVDPWLLNVSGTCPLCRIDLRPKEEQEASANGGTGTSSGSAADGANAPPLGSRRGSNAGRRDSVAFAGLLSVASASREDRIAALRRYRQQRRNRANSTDQLEEERRGLSSRLRERFRVRTRRQGEETTDETAQPS